MKFFLISNNTDTLIGMRLAGVEGVIVHTNDELNEALDKVLAQSDIAIVLVTEKIADMCRERINHIKLKHTRPLISEIPDRHNSKDFKNTISGYVKEAIGIKI